ncbi:hypothetical protein PXK16_10085 [Phaeobacter gallaeciensis]|nr:hypothetical protein [Phaeobacter gallaeciensis]MDE4153395.1 hypothetical protein [Phaeobacter gallaeciensis]MDE4257859.1 hypothetical protein [Phaeobacter gallaeciensis]
MIASLVCIVRSAFDEPVTRAASTRCEELYTCGQQTLAVFRIGAMDVGVIGRRQRIRSYANAHATVDKLLEEPCAVVLRYEVGRDDEELVSGLIDRVIECLGNHERAFGRWHAQFGRVVNEHVRRAKEKRNFANAYVRNVI